MSKEEVVDLMMGSKSASEWDANCDTVKAACGGYPPFWWSAIVQGGIMAIAKSSWQSPR